MLKNLLIYFGAFATNVGKGNGFYTGYACILYSILSWTQNNDIKENRRLKNIF